MARADAGSPGAASRRAARAHGADEGALPGDGVHLRFLRSYTLAEGETSNEPIVVIGGSARIDGRVADDVVVVGGGLHLGPKAVIEGNAVSVGGSVSLDPGASVQGSIDEAGTAMAGNHIRP